MMKMKVNGVFTKVPFAPGRRSRDAPPSMRSALRQAIVALVESAPDQGMAMGSVVDTLEHNGYAAQDVEHEIWAMLGARRLTPAGFICRKVRSRPGATPSRTYEFLLVPWSSKLDGQLELTL